jgi:uncharacterized protein YkwD
MRSTAARAITPENKTHQGRRRFVAGLLAAVAVSAGVVALTPSAALADGNEGAFLAHLNSLRAAHGLAGLTLASDLNSIAATHSAQMAKSGTIYHNTALPNAVANWQTLGENVGMGPTVTALDNAFDASPEHYANEINSSYTQVGIGSVTDSRGEIFVTLDFRRPMNAVTKAPAKAPVVKAPAAKAPVTAVHQSGTATGTTTATGSGTPVAALTPAQIAATAVARAAAARHAAAIAREDAALRTRTDPLAQALVFQQTLTALHS